MSIKKKIKEAPPLEKQPEVVKHAIDIVKENDEYVIIVVAYSDDGGKVVNRVGLENMRGVHVLNRMFSILRSKIMDGKDFAESLK